MVSGCTGTRKYVAKETRGFLSNIFLGCEGYYLVGGTGIEPVTSTMSMSRSNQVS